MNFYKISEFFRFYRAAITKYQLHSSFVFELACAIIEDKRWYYAFSDVEIMRSKMLASDVVLHVVDYGAKNLQFPEKMSVEQHRFGVEKKRSVRSIARQAGSSAAQGQMLFRLANHLQPRTVLEFGTSVGIGSMYLASAVQEARFISLEGSPEIAQVARVNLDFLGLAKNVEIIEGPFEQTMTDAIRNLESLDLIFFDGNHRSAPTLRYFEACLAASHKKTVFVFDDAYWSKDMTSAWAAIKNHPRVTLTLDFFELSLAFIDPGFREKQHFQVLPAIWKPWRFL